MSYDQAEQIKAIIDSAQRIVIIQADNPDADSLGSALALEHILGDLGKEPLLYCAVDMPGYLRYLQGWDRVQKDLPQQFDASIIVDVNTLMLLEKLNNGGQMGWLKSKPSIVLDHHASVDNPIDFAHVTIADEQMSSTGELIFRLSKQLGWPVSNEAGLNIMASILGDTQGLTNDLARSSSYQVMAELIDLGVSRPRLEELRRESSKMAEVIYRYKGRLIERTELAADGQIACITIPQTEINEYSPLYNPAVLIQMDTLQIQGVKVSIIFKTYDNGRITAKIRCNTGAPIANKLAEHFGAGGHPYAAGFKVLDKPSDQVKTECLATAAELLATLEQ
jgi:phosphoesterase RecJ-like protein